MKTLRINIFVAYVIVAAIFGPCIVVALRPELKIATSVLPWSFFAVTYYALGLSGIALYFIKKRRYSRRVRSQLNWRQ